MGIPTIASCTDEFRYAIENGKNGFLVSNEVELEDSLLRLIGDKALRKEMGIAAREDVMVRYLPSPRAKELVQILHEMKRKEALEPGHISDVK
jgi:glycosyltransferase involved in cell wall biosynthesis